MKPNFVSTTSTSSSTNNNNFSSAFGDIVILASVKVIIGYVNVTVTGIDRSITSSTTTVPAKALGLLLP